MPQHTRKKFRTLIILITLIPKNYSNTLTQINHKTVL